MTSPSSAASDAVPALDVLRCSASELASYLLEHRFEDDAMATTTFLLEGVSALPGADAIAAELVGNAEDEGGLPSRKSSKKEIALVSSQRAEDATPTTNAAIATLGKALLDHPVELSLINPRGKLHVMFHQEGIHGTTVKNPQSFVIPAGAVRDIIVFPKPQDCQKVLGPKAATATSNMVLICFQDQDDSSDNEVAAVTFKNKPLSQLCFPLPTTDSADINGVLSKIDSSSSDGSSENEKVSNDDNNKDNTSTWIRLFCHSLQVPSTCVYRIHNPTTANSTKTSFKSHQEANTSTTTGGMPFVKCYQGVQDGVLFPIQEGLLFFKPPMFIPRGKLHSIACGRGSGTSSRYVDMVLTTNNEESIEFTNIDRAEMGVLNVYIHKVLIPAMKKDSRQQKDTDEDDSDDDEEAVDAVAIADDDGDENDGAVAEVGRQKEQRTAKLAAQHAQKQHVDESDDDSEEDGDFSEPGDDSSDEDDDSDDEEGAGATMVALNGDGHDDEEEEEEEGEEDREASDAEHGDDNEETEDEGVGENISPKVKKQRVY